jgi:hypothetical protein
VKYYKKYFLSILFFLTIIFILFIFSVTALAIPDSEKNENINSLIYNNRISINHILFKLEVIDITNKNLSNLNLNRLEYEKEADQEFNLINQEELIEIFGNNFEFMLEAVREQETEELILSPRIIVAPGHKAVMRVVQEELFLDVESVDSVTYTNAFELEVFPRNSFDEEENSIFTTVKLKTGEGPTGIETEIWIKPYQPYLLAVMESSKKNKTKKLIGNSSEVEKRYFAVYLTARPVGILTLPELSSSLAGLEEIFSDLNVTEKEIKIILKYAYEENNDQNHRISLAGFYQNNSKIKFDFNLNEVLTDRHTISLSSHFYDNLWLGIEFISLENEETELALKFSDMVEIGSLKLSAAINPLVYNFETDSENVTWYLRGETTFAQKLNLTLEYKSLVEYDFAEVSLAYDLNNYGILLGYTWNLDIEKEESYWLGLQYDF